MQITELFPSSLEVALMDYSDGTIADFMPDFYTSLPDLQNHLLYPCAGGLRTLSQPDSFAFQDVNSYLLLYTVKGEGMVQAEGDQEALAEGSLLLWDCQDYLRLRPTTAKWGIRLVFFSGESADIYYEEICKISFPVFTCPESTQLADNIRRLTELGLVTSPHHAFEENRLLTNILSDLLLTLYEKHSEGKAAPPYLMKIKELFDTDYQHEHTVTDLAASFSVSRYRLCRDFAQYYGMTPIKYLNSVRLTHARTLLETTNLRIHEVASRVGIDSITHFINLFKASTGTTPAAYREGYRSFREIDHK
ncbi:MAG: helix-turn-helix transcriptional regulator [Lachnospiraceae bacterium]|nr:helix-turn-helix transcriptional regulator [Lachnospiraceae bacterium]